MECERPAFWRMPENKSNQLSFIKKKVHFNDQVQVGSPAQPELLRGDIVTKVNEYDARDLRHEDAQQMFKTAGNHIKLVIRRDDKVALHQTASNGSSRSSSTNPPFSHSPVNNSHSPLPSQYQYQQPQHYPQQQPPQPHQHLNFPPPQPDIYPYSTGSPLPHGPHNFAAAMQSPIDLLPHTIFPHGEMPRTGFSPMPTRDYQQDDGSEAISNQPYRTTPLVLPGAKVKKDNAPTESYLRHHPNPAMRAGPPHDFLDTLMKQKVADSMIHRIIGDEPANGPKVVHKQFNSPIGLYSDSNIEHTLKHSVPQTIPSNGIPNRHMPTKTEGYKKTVVFDPCKSETYRALQEHGHGDGIQEVPTPIQPRLFQPNRMVPAKKPNANHAAPQPDFKHVNSMGDPNEIIHQSGSFKRLMYHVLGETDY